MIAATGGLIAQVDWLGVRIGSHLAEPDELSQWCSAMMTAP